MVSVGTVINERYRLEALLGEGGMGVVFEATHLALGRTVAVKVVRRGHADGADAAARLLREARVVGTLRSQHVTQVLDVGEHEGEPFLVMELLHGRTLQHLVRDEGPRSVEDTAALVIQACHALEDAHRHGIVHRDVKPSNMFLIAHEGDALFLKVIDFGISKSLAVESHGETKTGAMLGSPSFMSPEQIRSSRDVDGRADLWSLGVVTYFLLTATKPFEAESLLDLMTSVVHESPPSLRALRPDVPEGLEQVVLRCLAKNREDRYASAAELAHALAPFAAPGRRELAFSLPLVRPPPSSHTPVVRAESAALRIAESREPGPETLSLSVTAPLRLSKYARPRTRSLTVIAVGIVLLGAGGALAYARYARRAAVAVAAASTEPALAPSAGASSPLVLTSPRSSTAPSTGSAGLSKAPVPPAAGAGGGAVVGSSRKRPHVVSPARPARSPVPSATTAPGPASAQPEIPKTPD